MIDSVPNHGSLLCMIIRPREIHYLRFTLEAYEGLATLTTLQPQMGLVQLNVAPGCEEDVLRILDAERERLHCRFTSAADNGENPHWSSIPAPSRSNKVLANHRQIR